jgi:chromosome partitioning protein
MNVCVYEPMNVYLAGGLAMRSIAFFAQKGGSGKTTLAVHIAVAAGQAGERVVLIDTDPQASANAWAQVRQQDRPPVVKITPADLQRVLDAAAHDKMTLTIIDTAPHAAPGVATIAALADFLVIPCRPTAFDLAAIGSSVNIIRAAKTPAAFVLNACPSRAPEIEETQDALSAYGLPVAPVHIGDRRAYARAVASGRAVTEFEAHGKAAEEIQALWKWIKRHVKEK